MVPKMKNPDVGPIESEEKFNRLTASILNKCQEFNIIILGFREDMNKLKLDRCNYITEELSYKKLVTIQVHKLIDQHDESMNSVNDRFSRLEL